MKKNGILKLAGMLALSAVMLSGCAGSKEKGQAELFWTLIWQNGQKRTGRQWKKSWRREYQESRR